jgi:hypothetical protein
VFGEALNGAVQPIVEGVESIGQVLETADMTSAGRGSCGPTFSNIRRLG